MTKTPDQPKHYRLGKNRKETDFTTESTPDYGVKGLGFGFVESGVATIVSTIGGIANPKFQESVSVDKDKIAEATQTITESVSVTVT